MTYTATIKTITYETNEDRILHGFSPIDMRLNEKAARPLTLREPCRWHVPIAVQYIPVLNVRAVHVTYFVSGN